MSERLGDAIPPIPSKTAKNRISDNKEMRFYLNSGQTSAGETLVTGSVETPGDH
jgi:hypothetical protein